MLNAFTAAIKRVRADNFVDHGRHRAVREPDRRVAPPPARVLARRAVRQRAGALDPARFDALAHHPYGAPLDDSFSADDLPVRGIGRLVSRAAQGRAPEARAPARRRHRIWITELGIETNPPDPDGVSPLAQENYLQTLALPAVARGRRHHRLVPGHGRGSRPRLRADRAGRPVPAVGQGRSAPPRAFAFPFATDPDRPRVFWGLAPHAAACASSAVRSGRWVLVRRVTAGPGRSSTGRGSLAAGRSYAPGRGPDQPQLARPLAQACG